ncbi:methylated-DNA--[protein]-cysteine S-methyltransferase [Aquabacterium soli]|jgi:methylated-DNA-[protein]-cysteine S-methyltransferase|uniref:Methylated-DNA--protein-cysteine methyltransferase n=1 Tax=Aquabacterium soli TaxID=2493092 RepID=A0A3R8S5D5_9BURK|nr:methylated-DNA--[protein]-cysteine S-methyltransferase [Aquabacterium soli]RRS02745.1 methylated-DNA--[protein]-cysteine S-methyltransferase [Aquabacterium soli]
MPLQTPRYTAQATMASPLGDIRLACTAAGLAGAWFTDGQTDDPGPFPGVPVVPQDTTLQQAAEQFDRYWQGKLTAFDLPLDPQGTPFQVAVWRALLEIPFGATLSYGDIAARIGQPKAYQAVGMAVGANPLIVIVPCHRIIGRDARLTGFSSGLPRKIDLLRREGLTISGDVVAQPDQLQATLFGREEAAP